MKSVEVRQAFEWTCEECGVDNFGRLMEYHLDPEEEAQMKEEAGVEPKEGMFVLLPEIVKCSKCGVKFNTQTPEKSDDF